MFGYPDHIVYAFLIFALMISSAIGVVISEIVEVKKKKKQAIKQRKEKRKQMINDNIELYNHLSKVGKEK